MDEIKNQTNIMDVKVSIARVWLFRILTVVAAGVMLVSWSLPWWTIDIEGFGTNMVQIRPWGLVMSDQMGGFAILLKGAPMPSWFAPAMWAYLGLCLVALLVGLWVVNKKIGIGTIKMKLSQFLIGGVGFSYLVAGVVAVVYASMRMAKMGGIPLQGRAFVDMGDPLIAYVNTRLLPGYYLIFVAGILFLVLAIFQDKIIGRPEPEA
jgi:hypothetical protein